MPTVLRIGPYRFSFYAADRTEPPHVHVKRDRSEAKFWLVPSVRASFVRGLRTMRRTRSSASSSRTATYCCGSGMPTSIVPDEPFLGEAERVVATDHQLTVYWKDGRTLSVPLAWYPRLVHGTPAERNHVEIGSFGIHWPDLDEDLSYKGLLLGWKSGESQKSLARWLDYRARGEKVPVPTLPLPPHLAKALARGEAEERRKSKNRRRKAS